METTRSSDQQPIEMLNTLLGVNNNRIECYHYISSATDVSVLQVLFSRLTETSINCREELIREVYKLGGEPIQGTLVTSDFMKAWLEVHSALKRNDHKGILDSCCYEEGVVIGTYESMIRRLDPNAPAYRQELISRQYDVLKADSEKLENLRSVLSCG